MQIAFVTSLVPGKIPTSGYEIANLAIINALRALGHDVTIIGFAQPGQDVADLPGMMVVRRIMVENAHAASAQKLNWAMRAVKTGLPIGSAKLLECPWNEFEATLDRAGPFDALILNSFQLPGAYPKLMERPYIYVAHNVEHLTAAENAAHAGGLINRLLYRRDADVLKKLEAQLCQQAQHVFCLSEEDRELLCGDSADLLHRSSMLPLVTPARQTESSSEFGDLRHDWANATHDVGLIGTWTWQPNLVGLRWFLDGVLPHIDGEMSICIAGKVPDGLPAHYPGVRFLGRVESAEEFVAQSRVMALVSRGGTGVQLKTIEAFQMGKACVATSSSLRGISHVPQNCTEENDPDAFAEHLSNMSLTARTKPVSVDGSAFYDQQWNSLLDRIQWSLEAAIPTERPAMPELARVS